MHQMTDASDWKDYGDLSPTWYQRLWEHPGWLQLLPTFHQSVSFGPFKTDLHMSTLEMKLLVRQEPTLALHLHS